MIYVFVGNNVLQIVDIEFSQAGVAELVIIKFIISIHYYFEKECRLIFVAILSMNFHENNIKVINFQGC